MEPSIPPPSPLPPTEPGPSLRTLDTSTQLLDTPASPNLPKQDLERAILIECSEVYAQALARDWEGVAALGMAMDLKHPLSAYPLKGEHTPPHVAFLFPYFIAQLILGNSRGTLTRLIALESIVSQHPVFQSLNTLAYTLATRTLQGIFPALHHLEEVLQKTHDPRFDFEMKEVSLVCVRGLRESYRSQTARDIARAYSSISADRAGLLLGFTDDPSGLQSYARGLGWGYDAQSRTYRPHLAELDPPASTHLGFNDLKFLTTETVALDNPM